MPLFQNAVVTKYLSAQDKTHVANQWNLYKDHFFNAHIQENIRNSKEEQYQGEFLTDLFVKVLGYTKNPSPNYNITTEYKNIKDSKKADGAIIIKDAVRAVIELKGTNTTDLTKIETQAFGYKNNQPDCTYVITSNFEKLRFYIDNAIEFEEFNLFTLSAERFELLYLCLAYENIERDIPKKIKDDSVGQEDIITRKLYNDYSLFKRELYQNLTALNPACDPLELFQKTQKLLDRFLFLLFAEDRQLLPPNSVRLILEQWKALQALDENIPLYNRFRKYFEYLNTGHKGKQYDVFAYNGGLFKADEILDRVTIDDNVLYEHTLKLSQYDFASEVDVNILGHIFENSLNEIDEIKAQLAGEQTDKGKTKRKKDGVFYTPKYITKYIVENTIGKLCTELKAGLAIDENEYIADKNRQKKTTQALLDKLKTYRERLLQLTICDPACGSGAFLNQALDFLIREHRYTDELEAKLFGSPLTLSDIDNSILENNLFGVDINEESVEIAKLSLWLRTARPQRKLNDLNKNIKCGNSLIDDASVAGDKAFNWQAAFPQVFEKGGFDVVIGNPPYVVLSSFKNDEFEYLQNKYKTSFGRLNLFSLFIERSTELIKEQGKVGLIIPDSLCLIDYYSNLRKYLLDKFCLNTLIELGNGIFQDATVPALIFIFTKSQSESILSIGFKEALFNESLLKNLKQSYYLSTPKYSFNLYVDEIFLKLNSQIDCNKVFPLKDLFQIKIGVCTGNNKKHISKEPIFENSKLLLQGKDINKYKIEFDNTFLNYSRKELLRARDEEIFLKPEKILLRQTSDSLIAAYDESKFYVIDSLFIIFSKNPQISLKYLIAILNSSLLNRQYQKLNPEAGRVFAQVKIDYVNELPIHLLLPKQQLPFIQKADTMLALNKELQEESRKFKRTIERKFDLSELSKKLQAWYTLTYAEFIKELGKKKITLSLSDEAEWESYFEQEKQKAVTIKNNITATDKEIDEMVYELYGLTEEERKIVEGV